MFHVREPGFDLILAEPIIIAPDITARQPVDVFHRLVFLSVFLANREPEYYDYGHGESTESYESYGEKTR